MAQETEIVSEPLAEHFKNVEYEDITPNHRERFQDLVLDIDGYAFAGIGEQAYDTVLDLIPEVERSDQ